jgi:predicted kinase
MDRMRPTLIVVSGPPASGKTSLAHALARAVHCPAICRDEIKEGFVLGARSESFEPARGDGANLQATTVFLDVVEFLLQRGVTLVAEASFQHHRWAPRLTAFAELASLRIINCAVDDAVAHQRRRQRWINDPWRRRFHADPDPEHSARAADSPPYQPVRLARPTLIVDTSDGYRPTFDEIVSFARG